MREIRCGAVQSLESASIGVPCVEWWTRLRKELQDLIGCTLRHFCASFTPPTIEPYLMLCIHVGTHASRVSRWERNAKGCIAANAERLAPIERSLTVSRTSENNQTCFC